MTQFMTAAQVEHGHRARGEPTYAGLKEQRDELLERLEWAMRRLCRYPDCPEPEHAKGYTAIAKAKGE